MPYPTSPPPRPSVVAPAPAAALRPGTRILDSIAYRPGTVRLPDAHEDGSGAAVVIEGDGITVDFGGLVLRGTPADAEPDARKGTGILVRGKNVTIKNVCIHGYKVGLLAKNAPGLRLQSCDFSYNWKQRLRSTPEREDLSDWMSFHHNEKGEWLRYGAAIYLDRCDNFRVENCRATGGQCGLMLNRSNKGLAFNNDFSFLSGIGVGLYRSSENRVMHNRIDWCVRGYSHGVYNRGQDSAGILVFEQCNKNTFAYNSVTHGGDGFFLWAGQTTMDTGKGGCNDNVVAGNDFSHAPTNGIEATFSRNQFLNNKVLECWHGVWGGYSYDTRIAYNLFGLNAQAIAIEHGQKISITNNQFFSDGAGVVLWQNPTQDPDWAYPKTRDTRSRDHKIASNGFVGLGGPAVRLTRTADIVIESNGFHGTVPLEEKEGVTGLRFAASQKQSPPTPSADHPPTMLPSGASILSTETDVRAYALRFEADWDPRSVGPDPLPNGQNPFRRRLPVRGRRYILVDEWGPYDFRRPLLWPRDIPGKETAERRFEILGPSGKWKVKSLSPGVTLSAPEGTVPGEVTATVAAPKPGAPQELRIDLEYTGGATTDYRGIVTPAGKPVAFGRTEWRLPIAWRVRWFRWEDAASDPRTKPEAFASLIAGTPLAEEEKTGALDYAWPGAPAKGVPADRFATVAEGTFTAPPGEYTLEVTTDDGCRITLDDKPVLEGAWKYQGPTPYSRPVTLSGDAPHTLRVEHFEIDGYSTLQVRLRPKGR